MRMRSELTQQFKWRTTIAVQYERPLMHVMQRRLLVVESHTSDPQRFITDYIKFPRGATATPFLDVSILRHDASGARVPSPYDPQLFRIEISKQEQSHNKTRDD
jgi:hypothetical protein